MARKSLFNQAPPGGWTEADRVPSVRVPSADELAALRVKASAEAHGSAPTTLRVRKVLMPDNHWWINGVRQP